MADNTISHDRAKLRTVAVDASVGGVTDAVTVCIGVWDERSRRDWLAVQQMVAVNETTAVTNAALRLRHIAKRDVKHPQGLVDWWRRYIRPGCIGKKQRQTGDPIGNDESAAHLC